MIDFSQWNEVPSVWEAHGAFEEPDLKSVFLEGAPCAGKMTRAFAYYALPEGASPGNPVPGVVLVHGGGAAALADWVRLWTGRGYAAISMDTCGHVPTENGGRRPASPAWSHAWDQHEWSGPEGWGGYEAGGRPVDEQWPYQAVAAVLRSRAFLASLPEVDSRRIGITGVSWGGFLTCLAAGACDDFLWACPVYGCGFLGEHSSFREPILAAGEQGRRWSGLWDPSVYLPHVRAPFLWVDSPTDQCFPIDSVVRSADLLPGECHFATIPGFAHGHRGPGEGRPEILAFADAFTRGGPAPICFDAPSISGGFYSVRFHAQDATSLQAVFNWTSDPNPEWHLRRWQSCPVGEFFPADGLLRAEIPPNCQACFANLVTDGGCVASAHVRFPSVTAGNGGD